MKETPEDLPFHKLPPCPRCAQAVRLFVERSEQEDQREQTLIEELTQHVNTCPTCAAAIEQAHRQRDVQRQALRALLAEGERLVPSSVAQVMARVRREAGLPQTPFPSEERPEDEFVPRAGQQIVVNASVRPHRRVRYLFTMLAVAAILLIVLGTFSQFVLLHSTTPSQVGITPVTLASAPGSWSSVLVTRRSSDGAQQLIENYNPGSGNHQALLLHCCPVNTVVDGVAHHGTNLIYHYVVGQKTYYRLLSGQQYVANGKGGNAVWSTKDDFIYIEVPDGVLQIDVQHSTQKLLSFASKATSLAFYRDNFLYFIRSQGQSYSLSRVNLASGEETQVVSAASSPSFWLSIDGTQTYYLKDEGGQRNLYSVGSDGAHPQLLRTGQTPIGYAADGSLMTLQQTQSTFQVVQLGDTPQQDAIVVNNVAPGATALCQYGSSTPICDSSVALAPYAGSLVVGASYADGSYKVWSLPLQSSQNMSRLLLTLDAGASAQFQLIGWDTLITR